MAYSIKYGDITDFKGDAILNSLGVNGSVYGRLCKNIIKNVQDDSVKAIIDSKTHSAILDVYITGAGKLPTKNIIHIVTPFKKNDDSNNTLLKNAYKKVIDTAIEQGYRSIAIPFVGTGANGYSDKDAHDAALEECGNINLREENENKDIIDITIITYLNKRNEYNDYFKIRNRFLVEKEKTKALKVVGKENYTSNVFSDVVNFYSFYNREEELNFDLNTIKVPFDFVFIYLNKKNINPKLLVKSGLDRKKKYNLSIQKSITNIDIFRIAFILKMNISELIQFMTISGVTFSLFSNLDIFFMKYMMGDYDNLKPKFNNVETLMDLNSLAATVGVDFDEISFVY